MKEIRIKCNLEGKIAVDEMAKKDGINVVLVNERDIPIARYGFEPNKIMHKDLVGYSANNYKIDFDIVPTVIFEIMPLWL